MSDNEESLVTCETTKGSFTMKTDKIQFGISYSDDVSLQHFAKQQIKDDPKKTDPAIPFEPGIISYAGSGPNSRTSQIFISYGSAKSLGTQPWETPIGKVIEGMESTVTKWHSYGDGPQQGKFHKGPEYIEKEFPLLDKFMECHVERIEGGDVGGQMERAAENEDPPERDMNLRKKRQLDQAHQNHRDLRNPAMFEAQKKILKEPQGGTSSAVLAAEAVVLVLVLVIILGLLKGRKKIVSKTS